MRVVTNVETLNYCRLSLLDAQRLDTNHVNDSLSRGIFDPQIKSCEAHWILCYNRVGFLSYKVGCFCESPVKGCGESSETKHKPGIGFAPPHIQTEYATHHSKQKFHPRKPLALVRST